VGVVLARAGPPPDKKPPNRGKKSGPERKRGKGQKTLVVPNFFKGRKKLELRDGAKSAPSCLFRKVYGLRQSKTKHLPASKEYSGKNKKSLHKWQGGGR